MADLLYLPGPTGKIRYQNLVPNIIHLYCNCKMCFFKAQCIVSLPIFILFLHFVCPHCSYFLHFPFVSSLFLFSSLPVCVLIVLISSLPVSSLFLLLHFLCPHSSYYYYFFFFYFYVSSLLIFLQFVSPHCYSALTILSF